jgi:hypothetical protein
MILHASPPGSEKVCRPDLYWFVSEQEIRTLKVERKPRRIIVRVVMRNSGTEVRMTVDLTILRSALWVAVWDYFMSVIWYDSC